MSTTPAMTEQERKDLLRREHEEREAIKKEAWLKVYNSPENVAQRLENEREQARMRAMTPAEKKIYIHKRLIEMETNVYDECKEDMKKYNAIGDKKNYERAERSMQSSYKQLVKLHNKSKI